MPLRRVIDPVELRRLLVDERLSYRAAAKVLGVSGDTVAAAADRLGIESVHTGSRRRRDRLRDEAWMTDQFAAGRSIVDVADELGVNYWTVVTARRALGLARPRGQRRPVDIDETMRRLEAGESMGEIGRALGHSSATISKAVRRHRQPSREP